MIKRILIYIPYYIINTPKKTFLKYFKYVKANNNISAIALYKDILVSSVKYNISFMDYFQLRFYEKKALERTEYAGTGFMYEYQLKMNPAGHREILENKIKFLNRFGEFSGRQWATLDMFEANASVAELFLQDPDGKLVLKNSTGQSGKEIMVVDNKDFTVDSLLKLLKQKNYDLVEKFVVQHPELMKLSPTSLNTIRIITQFHKGKIIIIGARLRVGVNSTIDNLSAGNFAAPIDHTTGIVSGPGVYLDITKKDEYVHPVTGVELVGFVIPYWNESINMVINSALLISENKSIGWDVAITSKGPILIEGNHNWGRVLWQLPVKKGLKKDLLAYYTPENKE